MNTYGYFKHIMQNSIIMYDSRTKQRVYITWLSMESLTTTPVVIFGMRNKFSFSDCMYHHQAITRLKRIVRV